MRGMTKFLARNRDALARRLFFLSVVMLAFAYGVGASQYQLFPVPLIKEAKAAAQQLLEESGASLPWYYQPSTETASIRVRAPHALAPGLRLISGLGADEKSLAKVVDADGRVVHSWRIDWFKIWPHPEHLAADLIPLSNAGLVHGVAVATNGDLIFNFEELGMVRLDPCGEVVWKLPYRTHHSLYLDENGHIWAPGVITRMEKRASLPNYVPPFDDYTLIEVSPDGKILRELSVADLLLDNGLRGLLHMASIRNRDTRVTGDTLHLNDVETFPTSTAPGVFSPGDVMISLRNINTILVFDPSSRHIKFMSAGAVLRQHDPDFVDGNTISVFDNNNLAVWGPETTPHPAGHNSRIVRISATTNRIDVLYSGTREQPFFSDIMGTQQLLPNGNLLLTESIAGRVIEVDASGHIVWEYFNLVGKGLVAVVDDALLLPPGFDEAFFARALSTCTKTSQN
jgi:arylsulfotransferase ASST